MLREVDLGSWLSRPPLSLSTVCSYTRSVGCRSGQAPVRTTVSRDPSHTYSANRDKTGHSCTSSALSRMDYRFRFDSRRLAHPYRCHGCAGCHRGIRGRHLKGSGLIFELRLLGGEMLVAAAFCYTSYYCNRQFLIR